MWPLKNKSYTVFRAKETITKFNAFSILKCVAVSFWNLFLDAIITYRDNRSTIELDSYMLQGKSNALLHYLNFLGWYM